MKVVASDMVSKILSNNTIANDIVCLSYHLLGCCILWRRDRFVRHDYQSVQFDSTQYPPATTNTRCIGQLLALRLRTDLEDALGLDQLSLEDRSSLESGKKPERKSGVIVTNHHLYWPPNAMYERIRQGWIMRQQLIRFKQKHAFPAFMCGGKWIAY
jgi:hypothetical protein